MNILLLSNIAQRLWSTSIYITCQSLEIRRPCVSRYINPCFLRVLHRGELGLVLTWIHYMAVFYQGNHSFLHGSNTLSIRVTSQLGKKKKGSMLSMILCQLLLSNKNPKAQNLAVKSL